MHPSSGDGHRRHESFMLPEDKSNSPVAAAAKRSNLGAESLLDVYPRKIYFFPASGQVMLKKLRHPNNQTIIEREAETVPVSNMRTNRATSNCFDDFQV